MVIGMTLFLWGCGNVPREYVRMAEPGTTLTALTLHPEMYQGKVVLLGGTIVQEEEHEQSLWLRVKNRPLDQDYIPRRPADTNGPEAGFYWVVVANQKFPPQYRQWARMTVVGKVTDMQRFETEPVLSLLYVRGWGISSAHDGFWKNFDPSYIPSVPKSIYRN
jgi:starvation-inducible outer membrane lipoprotein